MIASIDFGASTTKAATLDAGSGEVRVMRYQGQPRFPTAVFLSPGGQLLVGRAAINNRGRAPDRLHTGLKQFINSPPDGLGEAVLHLGGGGRLPLVDAVAAVLRHAYAAVLDDSAAGAAELVLSHPVSWGGPQQDLLRDAARQAGIGAPLHLTDEAGAVFRHALTSAYGQLRTPLAVLDVGASTTDVVVLSGGSGDDFRPRFSGGLPAAGGDDLDAALLDLLGALLARRGERHRGALARLADQRAYEVIQAVQELKHQLSQHEESVFAFEGLPDLTVTRAAFEGAVQGLVNDMLAPLDDALDLLAGSDPVQSVVLSGGASTTPLLRQEAADRARLAGASFHWAGETGDGTADLGAVAKGSVRTLRPYTLRLDAAPLAELSHDGVDPQETPSGFIYGVGPNLLWHDPESTEPDKKIDYAGQGFSSINRIAYCPDSRRLAVGTKGGIVEVWQLNELGYSRGSTVAGRSMWTPMRSRRWLVTAVAIRRDLLAWDESETLGQVRRRNSEGHWVSTGRLKYWLTGLDITDTVPRRLVGWGAKHLHLFDGSTGERLDWLNPGQLDRNRVVVDSSRNRVYLALDDELLCYRVNFNKFQHEFTVELDTDGPLGLARVDGRSMLLSYDSSSANWTLLDGYTGARHTRLRHRLAGGVDAMLRPLRPGYFLARSGRTIHRLHVVRRSR